MTELTTMNYEIKAIASNFECPKGIEKYMSHIFQGEYDVPYHAISPRILDIGANVGAFSVWATRRWPESVIYAYEPNDEVYPILCRNVASNATGRIITHLYGIGEPGNREFYQGVNNCGEASLYMPNGKPSIVRIDDPLTLPQASILKVDTEGCEVEIIKPLIEDGRKFDAIMYEYHRDDDRVYLENILHPDYALTGHIYYGAYRGVYKYIHRSLVPSP